MSQEKLFIIHSVDDLAGPVKYLLDGIGKKLEKSGVIVFFNGPLGSGKTAFIQELARIVGIQSRVQSPTFVLMKKYEVDSVIIPELYTLVHIDAYRLEPHHKESFRVEDFLQESGTLVCVEWPTAINLDNDLAYAHIDFEFMPKYTGNTELTEELYQERENMRRIKIRFKD